MVADVGVESLGFELGGLGTARPTREGFLVVNFGRRYGDQSNPPSE